LNRREFLELSVAGWLVSSLPPVVFLRGRGSELEAQEDNEDLRAHMIWLSESVAVPLRQNGPETAISSSSDGRPAIPSIDLHSVFFKGVTCEQVPTNASIRIFAYTRYCLYINGLYVGRGPSRFQNQRPEYDTRDIASVLVRGKNTVTILVHRDAPTGRIMHHQPGLAAVLQIGTGSSAQTISTDTTWRSKPDLAFGPRDEAWSSIEEHIDARKGEDWTKPEFAAAGWPPAVPIGGPDFFPVWPRTTPLQSETLRVWKSAPGPLPIDLDAGREAAFELAEIVQGYHSLEFEADEGSELEVSYALPNRQESGRSTFIPRSGLQTWMGGDTFAFVGLRIRAAAGRIRLRRAAAVEVRYPFERVGSFHSSDTFLNRLWGICARSLEVLSEDSYVDCADRERVEWTDDSPPAFDCTRVLMRGPEDGKKTHWADSRLLAGLLRRIALTQQPDGQLKAHSCSERFDIHAIMEDRSCDWIVQLREYFESSGDADLVRELWPTLTRLLDWYRKRLTPRGLVLAREWEVWDNPLRYEICEGAGLNAMVYRALVDACVLAGAMDKTGEADALHEEAMGLQSAFNMHLWNDHEGAYDGALFGPGSEIRPQMGRPFSGSVVKGRFHPTAQANLFALYADIVPGERLDSVRKWILSHGHEVQEPMSHYYLFRALYRMEEEHADELVLERMRSGWKNQVESEWQTTWEELENGDGSKVHIYGMHPAYFLTAFVLGARREGPVDRKAIVIDPRFSGLDWANGTCVTEFGPIEMAWKRDGDRGWEIDCTIPDKVQAQFVVPSGYANGTVIIDGNVTAVRKECERTLVTLQSGPHRIRIAKSHFASECSGS